MQDAGDGQIPVRFEGADQLGRARAPIVPVEHAGGFLVVARCGQAIGQGFNGAVEIGGGLVSVQAIEENRAGPYAGIDQ